MSDPSDPAIPTRESEPPASESDPRTPLPLLTMDETPTAIMDAEALNARRSRGMSPPPANTKSTSSPTSHEEGTSMDKPPADITPAPDAAAPPPAPPAPPGILPTEPDPPPPPPPPDDRYRPSARLLAVVAGVLLLALAAGAWWALRSPA
jgi:hypothetical protein